MKRLHAEGCRRIVGPIESLRVQDGERRRVVIRMPLYRTTLKDLAAETRAASGGADPGEEVVRGWLRMGLEALAELHERGVIHRDVKPSNFLVSDSGEMFVSDLGVARDEGRSALTRTGEVVGTDRYMAPEQRLASKHVKPVADVYALGVSVAELWCGEARIPPGKGLPGPLGELLRAMTTEDAAARPSASEALARISGSTAVTAPVAEKPIADASALEEWTEAFWWASRAGPPKLLDQKALDAQQRKLGLGNDTVQAVKAAFARNEAEMREVLAQALEDGEIEAYEIEALEQTRLDACISRREATRILSEVASGGVRVADGVAVPRWIDEGLKSAEGILAYS
jgi:hypothetical protein